MRFDFMKDVKIIKERENYYVVKATTRRFGKNVIMFEGISEKECKDYIRRESKIVVRDRYDVNKFWYVSSDRYGHYYVQEDNNGTLSPKQRVRKHTAANIIETNIIWY